jgi:hypothetical protein
MKNFFLLLITLFVLAFKANSQTLPADADFCWTESQTRGAGVFPKSCPAGEVLENGLCYKSCPANFRGEGPLCWAVCPSGWQDIGVSCTKPSHKRADYSLKAKCESANSQGCEKIGAIWYANCKSPFQKDGIYCRQACPSGFRNDGVYCAKTTQERGAGKIPSQCEAGMLNQAGLCYKACPSGFTGIGPVCWSNTCPSKYSVKCGLGCAKSKDACATTITNQILAPLEMIANIVGLVLSGGTSGVAKATAVTSAKTISKAAIKAAIKKAALEMGQEIAENMLENAAQTAFEAQLTGEFSWEDLDPTGVANVVKAYNKPLCKNVK